MASQPCERDGNLAKGRLAYLYPKLYRNGSTYRRRYKICHDCLQSILRSHSKDWHLSLGPAAFLDRDTCTSCGTVQDDGTANDRFFVAIFPAKDKRTDYEAVYCTNCGDMLVGDLGMTHD